MAGKQVSTGSKTADGGKISHVVAFGAAARSVSIPELLAMVFSFSEAPELARSAVVCKNWSDIALDELWRDLESVLPLLNLLGHLDLVQTTDSYAGGLQVLFSAIAKADWPRFHSYAKRVQVFRFRNTDTDLWDYPLVGAMCLSHPYGPSLLPRLRRLEWLTDRSALPLIPFLSEDLVHLNLQLNGTRNDGRVKEIISALRHRRLKLKTFRLDAGIPDAASEEALALFLEKMEMLEKLVLLPWYLSKRILTAIRTLPRLHTIDLPDDVWGIGYNDTGSPWTLPGGGGSFPSLIKLTLPATPAAANHLLFNSRTDFTGLTALNLHSEKDITADEILAFTQQLVDHCPMINTIELALFLIPQFRSQGVSVLPIKVIESLYPCKNLKTLRIYHPLPLKLNPADVKNMAHAWPQINHLYLCPASDFYFPVSEQMGTGLSILSAFALHLPNLQTLGLYFNGQDQITFAEQLYHRGQFTQLQTLIVGLSPIPIRVGDVGFYFASLCSRTANIQYGRTAWHGETIPTDHAERGRAWEKVEDSMAFAMQVKLAGQD